MDYIEGKFKHCIFKSDNGFFVGLLKVKSSSIEDAVGDIITFVGYFDRLLIDEVYHMQGDFVFNERFGEQFKVEEYNWVKPTEIDSIKSFLTSSFIKGCGAKSAQKLVDKYGDKTLDIIKTDIDKIKEAGISSKSAEKIFLSLNEYFYYDSLIMDLNNYGLSNKEIKVLIKKFGNKVNEHLKDELYELKGLIPFSKLDNIYFKLYDETNDMRKKALVTEAINAICFETGNTYVSKVNIKDYIKNVFNVEIENFDEILNALDGNKIVIKNGKYYLKEIYEDEEFVAKRLFKMLKKNVSIDDELFEYELTKCEKKLKLEYNKEQKNAIKNAIKNNISIITGGPGTGKTTVLEGLLYMFTKVYDYSKTDIAVLAPTGRAAKRINEITGFKTSTIHSYLKWNKELDSFGVDEYSPNLEKIVIVDEVSMLDINLASSLLKGILPSAKLVLVGDEHQLPSIRCGNVLKNLIDSDYFAVFNLKLIYRQSMDSYIPVLASNIKDKTDVDLSIKRDDFIFIKSNKENIKSYIKEVVLKYLDAGIDDKKLQVLIPMYRSLNGIDNINVLLQNIYNPKTNRKEEIKFGSIIYRENDKIINLENDLENNIFNGDIGYIKEIYTKDDETYIDITFENKIVVFTRENLSQIKHAYAISIHKSQGSEFDYVVMPFSYEYTRMLHNKLVYTGVSRARRALVVIGDENCFNTAIFNEMEERNTSLVQMLDLENLK